MFAIISLVAGLASSAYSAYAQKQQGDQVEANMQAEADALDEQAREEDAARAIESIEERKQSDRNRARSEASYVASGLLLAGTPSAMMVAQAEADEFNILSRDRLSYVRAGDMQYQGSLLRYGGEQAVSAGKTQATGTIIGGVAQAAGTASSYGLKVGSKSPKSFTGKTISYGGRTSPSITAPTTTKWKPKTFGSPYYNNGMLN